MTQTEAKPRKPPVYFGPRTWAIIRARYLRGETGRGLAETFGCSLAVIRKRAWSEGWTKRAQALAVDDLEPAPPPTLAEEIGAGPGVAPATATDAAGPLLAGTLVDMEPSAAARRALDQAMRMLLLGQTAKAADAPRVADLMTRTAERLSAGATMSAEPDDAAALGAVRRKVAAMVEAARAEGMREAERARG